MADREINLVGHFLKTLGAELEKSGSALLSNQGVADKQDRYIEERGVVVLPDEWIVIDPEDERLDVSLPQLRNILKNSSEQAGAIYGFLRGFELPADETREEFHHRRTALRLSVTLRDSLEQMHKLLSGEVLSDPPEREFEKPLSPAHPAMGRLSDEEMDESGYDGPMIKGGSVTQGANALFLAEIHADLRKVQGNIKNDVSTGHEIRRQIELVMGKIRERTEQGHA